MRLEKIMPLAVAGVVGCVPIEMASVSIPTVVESTIQSSARISGVKKIITPQPTASSLNLKDLTFPELKTCVALPLCIRDNAFRKNCLGTVK